MYCLQYIMTWCTVVFVWAFSQMCAGFTLAQTATVSFTYKQTEKNFLHDTVSSCLVTFQKGEKTRLLEDIFPMTIHCNHRTYGFHSILERIKNGTIKNDSFSHLNDGTLNASYFIYCNASFKGIPETVKFLCFSAHGSSLSKVIHGLWVQS